MKTTPLLLAICSTFAFVACQEKSDSGSQTTAPAESRSFDSILLSAAPAGALSIAEARPTVTPGKPITIEGKIMGRKDPFVAGRAMLVLGDPAKLTSCDIKDCSECPTPWDVCCDDPDDIKNFTATVQVLDADGKLIKQGLKGNHGIKELSQLIVTGTVAEGSNADNLLINATGIFIKP